MKKLIVSLCFSTLLAAPAFAQASNPKMSSGAFSAHAQVPPRHEMRRPNSHETRQPIPYGAYGPRWPGARYDENGYYIDPNSPGRW